MIILIHFETYQFSYIELYFGIAKLGFCLLVKNKKLLTLLFCNVKLSFGLIE